MTTAIRREENSIILNTVDRDGDGITIEVTRDGLFLPRQELRNGVVIEGADLEDLLEAMLELRKPRELVDISKFTHMQRVDNAGNPIGDPVRLPVISDSDEDNPSEASA